MIKKMLDIIVPVWGVALIVAFAIRRDWLGVSVVAFVVVFDLVRHRTPGTEATRFRQVIIGCLLAGLYYGVIAGGTFNLLDGKDFRLLEDVLLGLAFATFMIIFMSVAFIIKGAAQRRSQSHGT
jgi:hypothetical protein